MRLLMADLEDLLVKTSRTFALSIPQLEGATRDQVTLGYLLLRIADTLEDAAVWSREQRVEALFRFGDLLNDTDETAGCGTEALVRSWLAEPPSPHEGYLELLEATDDVLSAYLALDPPARSVVGRHVRRTCVGMAHIVRRADRDGELRLRGIPELRDYCYVVAGIVGEMLTELFLLGAPLEQVAEALRRRAAAFGEALQLVNILKDAAADEDEGRSFIRDGRDRTLAFELARADLEVAGEYVAHLQRAGAPRGYLGFTALPVRLAWATLARVEERGPGSKLTRSEVAALVGALHADLDAGRPAAGGAG
ncbi:MAG: squalene/phytoene synthase family protein [Acidobacteriota bacterium]|nr:squalene/phytoene synthase family protein [Acidobacteriota bacterium]